MTDTTNDNDPPANGDQTGIVLNFPSEPMLRRRASRYRLTHHADGRSLTADELAENLEIAVIMAGAGDALEAALDRACGDADMATLMLIQAYRAAENRALIDRAERILGPRRGIGGTPPRAA